MRNAPRARWGAGRGASVAARAADMPGSMDRLSTRPLVSRVSLVSLARGLRAALLAGLAAGGVACAQAPAFSFHAQHATVVDEATGAVLLAKDAQTSVPMASLTKLLTAMVVLDAGQDLQERLTIEEADLDTLKHTRSGVPVGTVLPREKLIELALLASDNRAASCLARHYPGGLAQFLEAVRLKTAALELADTRVLEPTGLSPANRSSASDLADVVRAAAGYPAIVAATTQPRGELVVNGKPYRTLNTNRLVGSPGWDILLSKTGFTNEAGRCLVMRLRAAGRTVLVVLLNAEAGAGRTLDALNVTRWLAGLAPLKALPVVAAASPAKATARSALRGQRPGKHA
jgi:D-alanyl-D-alanine carboxypeptidase/D-alanyl-D-alanine endopeptidase (penicillin-binding protein 7)